MLLLSLVLGCWLVLRRTERQGLDPAAATSCLLWMLAGGFLLSHLHHLAFLRPTPLLDPAAFLREPSLFNPWNGMSSFGGLVGGVLAAALYMRRKRWSAHWRRLYFDAVALAFPFAWALARVGCYLAHDHPGIATTSWLGVRHPEGTRFDLGLLEVFLALALGGLFLLLRRRERAPGFYLAALLLIYGPARLLLDTLRVEDRWLGLTGGQYGALAAILLGLLVLQRLRRHPAGRGHRSQEAAR
jgi:phosphatidylglycerol:prolipoprotein diacylglycerol transferase